MRTALLILTLGIVLAGCDRSSESETRPREADPAARPAAEEEARPPRPPRTFDAQGKLIPSDEYVAGVRMPRGVELFRADELTRVYRIRSPIDRVLAYFGPMMVTGNVERLGKGAVYKRASVRGAEMSPTKVELSIQEVGSNLVRISVTKIPPPPEYAPSATQTKAEARNSWRMLD